MLAATKRNKSLWERKGPVRSSEGAVSFVSSSFPLPLLLRPLLLLRFRLLPFRPRRCPLLSFSLSLSISFFPSFYQPRDLSYGK